MDFLHHFSLEVMPLSFTSTTRPPADPRSSTVPVTTGLNNFRFDFSRKFLSNTSSIYRSNAYASKLEHAVIIFILIRSHKVCYILDNRRCLPARFLYLKLPTPCFLENMSLIALAQAACVAVETPCCVELPESKLILRGVDERSAASVVPVVISIDDGSASST